MIVGANCGGGGVDDEASGGGVGGGGLHWRARMEDERRVRFMRAEHSNLR